MHLHRSIPELDSRRMARAIISAKTRPPWLPQWKLIGCIVVALIISYLPGYEDLPGDGRHMLFILVLAAGLWVTEAMPAFAVALLVIGLEILLLGHEQIHVDWPSARWQRFLEPWASPLIWLFLGGFVLSAAASKTRLDRRLTERVLAMAGTRPSSVLAALMTATFVLSAFMSNTATTAMMFVVLTPIIRSLNENTFITALCLGIPIAANLGGMSTIIGSPPNAIAAGLLDGEHAIGFVQWMAYGMPVAIAVAVAMWWWLKQRYGGTLEEITLPPPPQHPPGEAGRLLRWRQWVTAAVILLTIFLWMTTGWHPMPMAVVSFIPICLLTTVGVLDANDMRQLPWEVLMLLAGGLSLGIGVAQSGLADWMVTILPMQGWGQLAVGIFLAYATVIASNFMSNTAAANVVLPIALALAGSLPAQVVLPVALAASAAMALPISTPPNAIAYASGYLTSREFLRTGLVIGCTVPLLVVLWTSLMIQLW